MEIAPDAAGDVIAEFFDDFVPSSSHGDGDGDNCLSGSDIDELE